MIDHIASLAALLLAALAVGRTFMRKRLTVSQIATLACDHGEHAETVTMPRWKLSYEAATRLDQDDNGKRDYTDVQLRIAIDKEAKRRGWAART